MKKRKNKNNWNVPENYEKYFDPHYDDAFKAKHPILYVLTVIVIIVLVAVPPCVCIYLFGTFFANINNLIEVLVLLVGLVSSFGISIGFCNVFLIIHKQYLGHYVTIISFLIGLLGGGGSFLILWLMS